MMKDYAIYYSYKNIGDVIVIIFSDEATTKVEQKGRVAIIYHEDRIIGYNIFNVKDIIKIKSEGMIYLPSPTLIDIINSLLINEGCEPLEVKESSGYFVAMVVDVTNSQVTISLKEKAFNLPNKNYQLNVGDKVVIAIKGTRLPNGSLINDEGHICTYKDLGIKIEEDTILVLDKDEEINKDFFSLEEK